MLVAMFLIFQGWILYNLLKPSEEINQLDSEIKQKPVQIETASLNGEAKLVDIKTVSLNREADPDDE